MIETSTVLTAEPKYPLFFECIDRASRNYGCLMLFFSRDKGVMVRAGEKETGDEIGKSYPCVWCTNTLTWRPINVAINHG